jgi:hypothetical protein
MATALPALGPKQFLRSVAATRDTLGQPPMKLIDTVQEVETLTKHSGVGSL